MIFQAVDVPKESSVNVTAKNETHELPGSVETSTSSSHPSTANHIELATTADEARRRMSRKKDARASNSSISFRDKYNLFQQM